MTGLIIQYILIIVLVIVLGFLMYYLKDREIIRDEDYYGISFSILSDLESKDASVESIKAILRAVSDAVQFVEANFKGESNEIKQQEALEIAREGIDNLELSSNISDKDLIYLIRLSCAILPPTHEN